MVTAPKLELRCFFYFLSDNLSPSSCFIESHRAWYKKLKRCEGIHYPTRTDHKLKSKLKQISNNAWLAHHPAKALIFSDLENLWREMRSTCNGEFKSLVFGYDIPFDEQILNSLFKIRDRIELLGWNIIVPGSSPTAY